LPEDGRQRGGRIPRGEGFDVGDDHHGRLARGGERLAQAGGGRVVGQRGHLRRPDHRHGRLDGGGHRPYQCGFSGPGRAADERAERDRGAEPAQYLPVVEAEIEQLGEFLGLVAQTGQVLDGGRVRCRYRQRGLRGVGDRAGVPADHGVHGDQTTFRRLSFGNGQQRGRPRVPDRGGQAAPGGGDQRAGFGGREHVLGQQRDVVLDGDHLAEQREAQHLRADQGDDVGRPGEHHAVGGPGRGGRDGDLAAVTYPEVAQEQVVGVEHRAARSGLGQRDDAGGLPAAGQPDRVARVQAERGEHLGVQPDDAAPGVERGGAQAGGERQGTAVGHAGKTSAAARRASREDQLSGWRSARGGEITSSRQIPEKIARSAGNS
jgi:hypothetical protein